MYTKVELNKALLNILKDVRARVHEYLYTRKTWRFAGLGICSEVTLGASSPEIRYGCLRLLKDLMEQWPEFSGDRAYPVPHPDKDPKMAFDLASPKEMWSPESAYGAARLRLLDWLISQLEAEAETETEAEPRPES